MAECDWALLCDHSFLDVGRKLCLIGVFDRIYVRSVPATHSQLGLALKLLGDPGEKVKIHVDIIRPQGGSLGSFDGSAHLGDSGSAEFQMNVSNFPLPDFGLYSFNVHVGDSPPKSVTFTVIQIAEQSG